MSRERLTLGPCATVNQQQPWMRTANHMLSRHIHGIEVQLHVVIVEFDVERGSVLEKSRKLSDRCRNRRRCLRLFSGNTFNQSIISLLTYDKTHMLTLNTELQYKKSQ